MPLENESTAFLPTAMLAGFDMKPGRERVLKDHTDCNTLRHMHEDRKLQLASTDSQVGQVCLQLCYSWFVNSLKRLDCLS